ncbi:MAG: hypothetical protein ABFD82_06130 [Syntrophaceae bacterium]
MLIDKLPDQKHSSNVTKVIKCQDCDNERQITKQWLNEVAAKLSINSSSIDESIITKYLDRFYCSKCKGKNAVISNSSNQNVPKIEKRNEIKLGDIFHINPIQKNRNDEIPNKKKKETVADGCRNEPTRKPYQEPSSITKHEDYLAALERKKERDKQTEGIPDYEEGYPRTEFGSRDDHKKMRHRDWGDMKNRHRE